MALVDLADFKKLLGIHYTDTSDDAALQEALDTASEAVEDYCKRRFELQADSGTHYLALSDAESPLSPIVVPRYPIVTLDALTVGGASVALPTEDVRIVAELGVIEPTQPWRSFTGAEPDKDGKLTISIDWSGGYQNVPMPVRRATTSAASRIYRDIKAQLAGERVIKSEMATGVGRVEYMTRRDIQGGDGGFSAGPIGALYNSDLKMLDTYRSMVAR